MVVLAIPVFAIADPDSPPSVNALYVYEDVLEDGDCGVLIDYFLDYAATPSETATEAYLGVFVDTDGTTQLDSVAPYAFDDKGYGRGLIWIYFTATEVTAYGIDSANEALYRVWLMGNPTVASGWTGDPPKTIASIDYWQTTGDSAVLLALRVLYYADIFELAWTAVDLIEMTPLGNRLTATGEEYFTNAIPDLQLMAPGAFGTGEYSPTLEDIDYTTEFGATMTDGTGTVAGSPIDLVEGDNTETVIVTGTFILELEKGNVGTATSVAGGSVVTDSPVDLVYGTNTITATNAGTGEILINVVLENTQTAITGSVTGTALDLSAPAALFGMDTSLFSGLVWFAMSLVACAGVYRLGQRENFHSGGKVVMLVFNLCIVGGAVLGLLPILAAVLLFIAFGAFTGYILFFKPANV